MTLTIPWHQDTSHTEVILPSGEQVVLPLRLTQILGELRAKYKGQPYPGPRPSYLCFKNEEKVAVAEEARRWVPMEESLFTYMQCVLDHIKGHPQRLINFDLYIYRGIQDAIPQANMSNIEQRCKELKLSAAELLVYVYDKVKALPPFKTGELAEYVRLGLKEVRFPRSPEELDPTIADIIDICRTLHNRRPSPTEALTKMVPFKPFLTWRMKYGGGLQNTNRSLVTALWRTLVDLYIDVHIYISYTSSPTKRRAEEDLQHEMRVKQNRIMAEGSEW